MSNEHVDNEIPERGGLPIQDRDVAIIELWDVLERYVKMIDATRHPNDRDGSHPILEKYRRFVNEVRGLYGL